MSIILSDFLDVNCRVGSLETEANVYQGGDDVNCRVGSLEIARKLVREGDTVNCRVGSLENVHFCNDNRN